MLRKIRIALALIFLVVITLLFLDFTGTVQLWFGWMAEIQFLPALLALNVVVVLMLVAVTVILGRVYCSVICPLGVFQDVVSWFSSRRKKKKNRFSYSKPKNVLRYLVLVLFVAAMAAGFTALASVIAPYSAFGRIVSTIFAPAYRWVNNLLATLAEQNGSYAFYETEIWFKGLAILILSAVSFAVIFILAWRSGRIYCNTICPVGTVLGTLSRYAIFRPVIDASKCNGCSLCSRKCKSSCIDHKNSAIDYSRCVVCLDCIDTCRQGAIKYRMRKRKGQLSPEENCDNSRRAFLSASAIIGTTFIVDAQKRRHKRKVDGGLAVIQDKKIPKRKTPLVPAGAQNLKHFTQHCTACQLCVSVCPNQVLRPSDNIVSLMQPEMSYERGYCRPECTRCADVCPSNAIKPVSVEEKSSIQIGRAVWIKENCIVLTDGVKCGNCARHCPAGAILMVAQNPADEGSLKIPAVNTERCIGCGACENLCPARPFSAIYVEGNQVHRTI